MGCRRHRALAAGAASACLVLCGCGGSAARPAAAAGTVSAGKFCTHAASFMRHIPQAPAAKHPTEAQALASMRTVLDATVKGFTALERQAPAAVRAPLRTIVRVYQKDQQVLDSGGSTATVSQAMATAGQANVKAFSSLLRYISAHCR